jgi:hypothetical protein
MGPGPVATICRRSLKGLDDGPRAKRSAVMLSRSFPSAAIAHFIAEHLLIKVSNPLIPIGVCAMMRPFLLLRINRKRKKDKGE